MPATPYPPLAPLGPENFGSRISMRVSLPDGGFQDIVGTLESSTSIRKRTGERVDFDPTRTVAWRRIEPTINRAGKGAPLSMRINEMEIVAARTWPAKTEENLGDWLLRATGKFTMRANSVLAIGEPGCELSQAVEKVVAFYARHSLPPIFHIPLPTYEHLDVHLAQNGWIEKVRALVMIFDIDSPVTTQKPQHLWTFSSTVDEEWLQLQNDSGVRQIMESAPAIYASLKVDGALIAVGRAANFNDWTVLTRLFVREDYRRKNLGTELLSQLLHQAKSLGATKALLQVDESNVAAINVYKKYGFRIHHSYCYRVLPETSASQC